MEPETRRNFETRFMFGLGIIVGGGLAAGIEWWWILCVGAFGVVLAVVLALGETLADRRNP